MDLLGPWTLTLMIVALVAAFLAVVLLWPRVGRPGIGNLLSRVGMLVGVNLLVLLVAATALNDQYQFFADWTDLSAAVMGGPLQFSTHQNGASGSQAVDRAVGNAFAGAPTTLPSLPSDPTAGLTYTFTVSGPLSGIRASVLVQLPPGYNDPANAIRRYPVIETFPGVPGTPAVWIDTMDLGGQMSTLVAAHRMSQAIIVSPTTEVPAGIDTECVNGPAGAPQMETWVARDVPTWVVHHFRVDLFRQGWTTLGLSAGAWCAAMVTMLHPDVFGSAIVMGGYFNPTFERHYEPFRTPNAHLAARYNLIALATRRPPSVALWLETSHSDPVSYPSSALFLKATHSPLSVHTIVLAHAGHRISLWQSLLPSALTWLGSTVSGFRATA